jgi:hypothetical protein
MVPARWCNCPHSESIRGGHSGNVSGASYFIAQQASMVCTFPDLSACDYFLWGYLKVKVYTTTPQTINDFKINILKKISVIPENMEKQALGNLQTRLEECIYNNGQHFNDVLFKTK